MIETKEKEINGSRYTVTQLPARRALKLQYKLLKVFGAGLALIFTPSVGKEADGKTSLSINFNGDDVSKSLMLMMSNLDDNSFEALVLELLQGVRKDGVELTAPVIDFEFAGDSVTIFKVIWFVLEVNFSDFFGERGSGTLFRAQEPLTQDQTTPRTLEKT